MSDINVIGDVSQMISGAASFLGSECDVRMFKNSGVESIAKMVRNNELTPEHLQEIEGRLEAAKQSESPEAKGDVLACRFLQGMVMANENSVGSAQNSLGFYSCFNKLPRSNAPELKAVDIKGVENTVRSMAISLEGFAKFEQQEGLEASEIVAKLLGAISYYNGIDSQVIKNGYNMGGIYHALKTGFDPSQSGKEKPQTGSNTLILPVGLDSNFTAGLSFVGYDARKYYSEAIAGLEEGIKGLDNPSL